MRNRLGLDNGSAPALFRRQPAGRLASSIAISIVATGNPSGGVGREPRRKPRLVTGKLTTKPW